MDQEADPKQLLEQARVIARQMKIKAFASTLAFEDLAAHCTCTQKVCQNRFLAEQFRELGTGAYAIDILFDRIDNINKSKQ